MALPLEDPQPPAATSGPTCHDSATETLGPRDVAARDPTALATLIGVFLRENEIGGRVAPHLEPGWTVLDVGSGTGRLARWLAERRDVHPTLADVAEFGNRVRDLPFLRMEDPLAIPAEDDAFDAVLLLFVLHHMERWEDQERLVAEVGRVARRRVVLIEDTPLSRVDRAFNVAWDWALNQRHGIPVPFTFRDLEGWRSVFERVGLEVHATETYRARWPTLGTYRHTLFALDVGRA